MNWSPLNATPAVGFSQVSKAWRGSCGRRSARTLLHRDPASGSGGMLLSQTGILSLSAPRRSWSRRWLSPGLPAWPARVPRPPWPPGVLQLPRPFAAVPLVPVDGVVDVIPFALHPGPELARQHVDLVLSSPGGSRSGAIAVSRLSGSGPCDSGGPAAPPAGLSPLGPGGSFLKDPGRRAVSPAVSDAGWGAAPGRIAVSRLPGASLLGGVVSSSGRGAWPLMASSSSSMRRSRSCSRRRWPCSRSS